MQVIYCIINNVSGKKYVGSTINYSKRKKLHIDRLRNNIHHSPYLQNSWNKYGENSFSFLVLEKIENKEILLEREQWWIDNTNSAYNVCKIAGSSIGVKRRPETIEKVRQANLGLKHEEWRNKIKSEAQGGEKHWTKKKKFSEEAKEKMSETHRNLFKSGYIHPRKGVKESLETIEHKKLRVSKPIIQLSLDGDFIKEWQSAKVAHAEGFHQSYTSQCARGIRKTYKGFIWKFKKDLV